MLPSLFSLIRYIFPEIIPIFVTFKTNKLHFFHILGRHYELRSSYLPTFLPSFQELNLLMNRMYETCQILLMSNYDASLHFSDSQFFRFSDSISPSHVRIPPSKWMTSNPALESFSAASIL